MIICLPINRRKSLYFFKKKKKETEDLIKMSLERKIQNNVSNALEF